MSAQDFFGKAQKANNAKEYESALDFIQNAIELDEGNVIYWREKANILRLLNRYDESLATCYLAVNLNPQSVQTYYILGKIYCDKKDYDQAIKLFERAIELDKEYAFAWNGIGWAHFELKQYNEALQFYSRAIELDPHYAMPWNNKGLVYQRQKKYEKALSAFEKAIELNGELVYPWINKATIFHHLKQYKKAILPLNKAIELDGKNPTPWVGKGVTLQYLKQTELAYQAYNRAIEVDDEFAAPWYYKGILFLEQKKIKLAKEAFLKAKKLAIPKKEMDLLENLSFYLKQIPEDEKRQLLEAKVIVVGAGASGKTTLIKKLVNPTHKVPSPENSTHGIDIHSYIFKRKIGSEEANITSYMWDFGGQEIYHDTHQFFLTPQSLYILVGDTRKEDTSFDWWLHTISLLGDNSPVIIVMNEKEDRAHQLDETQLKKTFPNIRQILSVNPATNRGMKGLREALEDQIVSLEHVGQEVPKKWMEIRAKMKVTKKDYLNFDTFCDMCADAGVEQEENRLAASKLFHRLGACLHFQDDPQLEDLLILNPEWTTKAAYDLLVNSDIIKNGGLFSFQKARSIWKDKFPRNKHNELLLLLERFKLCYQIGGSKQYIAPQLLTNKKPEYRLPTGRALTYQYNYSFMPKGIISRFIVKMQNKIKKQLVWRNGVILVDKETEAEVIENRLKREIRVRIFGKKSKEMLYYIREALFEIHQQFPQLKFKELIPCICKECKTNTSPYYYGKEKIERALKKQRPTIECGNSFDQVPLQALLDNSINFFQIDTKTLTDLLIKNDFPTFFKQANDLLKTTPLENELTLLHSQFNSLEKDKHKGTVETTNLIIRENKLTNGCLSLIEQIRRSSHYL